MGFRIEWKEGKGEYKRKLFDLQASIKIMEDEAVIAQKHMYIVYLK